MYPDAVRRQTIYDGQTSMSTAGMQWTWKRGKDTCWVQGQASAVASKQTNHISVNDADCMTTVLHLSDLLHAS